MKHLPEQVEESIASRKLFWRGQSILVAVSGGLDSMALLHLLAKLAPKYDWKLTVAHFNHRLRGRSSDADERLVRKAAAQLKLPIVTGAGDVRTIAARKKLSVEMAARELRHAFLASTASRRRIPTIALAHHADDQVELFFLRLFRGAGGEGLGGMKWNSPSPANVEIQLVRPLLNQSREALRKWVRAEGIPYREDATNAQLDFQRNRIRRRLIPCLRKNFQPALDRTVLRAMETLRDEARLVRELAEQWLRRRTRERFDRLPRAVQRRVVQLQLHSLGVATEYDLIEDLIRNPRKVITVGADMAVLRDDSGQIQFREAPARVAFACDEQILALDGGAGETEFGPLRLRWKVGPMPRRRSGRVNPGPNCEWFDADKVGPRIRLRHWQPGDRFQPIGMAVAVKLQDWFANRKIPRERRHELAVAEAADGRLFWVETLRISECFKLDKGTVRRLKWQWQRIAPR